MKKELSKIPSKIQPNKNFLSFFLRGEGLLHTEGNCSKHERDSRRVAYIRRLRYKHPES
jgi:hypothetical protein